MNLLNRILNRVPEWCWMVLGACLVGFAKVCGWTMEEK
jgi:hypothetical protein